MLYLGIYHGCITFSVYVLKVESPSKWDSLWSSHQYTILVHQSSRAVYAKHMCPFSILYFERMVEVLGHESA